MSKAEERALEAYPKSIVEQEGIYDISSYDRNSLERKAFIKGYHQAEKDLALTWEDIHKIIDHWMCICSDFKWYNKPLKDAFQEVLRRFNELKK